MSNKTPDVSRATEISGYMAVSELKWLAKKAAASRVVVEIGSWKGRSTRAMGDNVGGVVYAVDHWRGQLRDPAAAPTREIAVRCNGDGQVIRAEFDENLRDLVSSRRVVPVEWNSQDGVPPDLKHLGDPRQVDFMFIDGDHSEVGVASDIKKWSKLVRGGGILAGHDYNNQPRHVGVRTVVDRMFGDRVKLHATIWWIEVRA